MDKLEKAIAAVKYGIRAAECAGNGKNLGRSSFVMMYTDDLDDILDLLKAQELPDVKPEKLEERTTEWLDKISAEERLKEIAAILSDWDGYRTAKGLAGLINEVWAYTLYPVKAQEPKQMIEMSYELIPREKAIEAIRDLLLEPDSIQYIFSGDAIGVVQNVPSVPAVPLDKLCVLLKELNESGYSFQCAFCKKAFPAWCEEKNKDIGWDRELHCPTWEEITEWMEGLDAEVH